MIHVLAFVTIKPGMLDKALNAYRTLVPKVMANEAGCLEYSPTTDFDLGLANQEKDRNMIVITERWASIDDFKAHIAGPPHVAEFRVAIKELLEKTSLKITQDAI